MRAFSLDLRERVLADGDAGQSNEEVAKKYRVSAAWIRRLKQRRRETGSIAPRPRHYPPPRLLAHAERLQELVQERPDATLQELREALGVPASLASFCRALQQLRLTVKKKFSGPRNRIVRMSSPNARSGRK